MKLFVMKLLRKIKGAAYSPEELRAYGVHVGDDCYIGIKHIDLAHGFLISIGNNVTVSNARILAHDASTKRYLGYSKVGRVTIDDNTFISLSSPVEMDDNTINKWKKQLEDYEIAQPLQQLTVIKLDKNVNFFRV